jgi:hypothetical protein
VVHRLDPDAGDESTLAGVREGDLARIFSDAGLGEPVQDRLGVRVDYPSFDVWWEPYTLGVGPAGDYLGGCSTEQVEDIRRACSDRLGSGPFSIRAVAWAVRATRN